MGEMFKDLVPLVEGITLDDLISPESGENEEGASSSNVGNVMLLDECDLEDSDNDSDSGFENLQESVDKLQLSPPEYENFDQLALQMKDCVPNGYIKLLVLEEGDGPLIPDTAEVTIHFAVYWEKKTLPFDSTITMNEGKPIKLQLGEGKHLAGLELGLTYVKGPRARLYLLLHPVVTWGLRGIPPRIKPERSLFVVTVFDVTDKVSNELPPAKKTNIRTTIETVEDIRKHGKILFSRQYYRSAIKVYQKAISVLNKSSPDTEEDQIKINALKVTFYTNLVVCYIKTNKPKLVLSYCENIDILIGINNHCKALFLRGKAFEMLNKNDDAIFSYKKALELEPGNKEILTALAKWN